MKQLAIVFVAIPMVFTSAGYVAGAMLIPSQPGSDLASPLGSAHEAVSADPGQTTVESAGTTPEPAAIEDHPESADMAPRTLAEDQTIVRLGQMTIPVEKVRSVSYVVADFALKVEDAELAQRYMRVEEAMRIRDALLAAMNLAAEGSLLRGVAIDSDALSSLLREMLLKDYPGIEDVLFVSLYKQDVARI